LFVLSLVAVTIERRLWNYLLGFPDICRLSMFVLLEIDLSLRLNAVRSIDGISLVSISKSETVPATHLKSKSKEAPPTYIRPTSATKTSSAAPRKAPDAASLDGPVEV
jgi:hypothetical protein